jgi:hypothetical protein
VTNPKCQDCRLIIPNFGMPADRKARWCAGCMKGHPGAVDVVNKKCEDCLLKQPTYGLPPDEKARWCAGCANGHAGAVNVAIGG